MLDTRVINVQGNKAIIRNIRDCIETIRDIDENELADCLEDAINDIISDVEESLALTESARRIIMDAQDDYDDACYSLSSIIEGFDF